MEHGADQGQRHPARSACPLHAAQGGLQIPEKYEEPAGQSGGDFGSVFFEKCLIRAIAFRKRNFLPFKSQELGFERLVAVELFQRWAKNHPVFTNN
jgi:hypothetical protein